MVAGGSTGGDGSSEGEPPVGFGGGSLSSRTRSRSDGGSVAADAQRARQAFDSLCQTFARVHLSEEQEVADHQLLMERLAGARGE